ncbi:hypothetical protein H632_c1352p0 [Helicosporidium sp. ATCC 50920]|nr:hypothetical protein H632_c1352p0 [Helicosporidium sp. ATCC 50920]|eukprot:KDD74383.1 hypothetical protein H632_c1352p0 [Helicosporidium sp. ATCC 50920]
MGKRKASKKAPAPKSRPKLEVAFSCPFCNSEKSVTCEMDRQRDVGVVKCNQCAAQYAVKIHSLSEPIDVYSDWIDECEKVNSVS